MFRSLSPFNLKKSAASVRIPVLAALLATVFIFTPGNVVDTQAGNSGISARKLKGGPSGHSSRAIRLGGENLSLRPVSRSFAETYRTISKRRLGGDAVKTYHRKRSVLDGHYGEATPTHRYTSHGRFNNIRRYGKIEYGSSKEARAGVVYNSGQTLRNKRDFHGLKPIAGGDVTITTRRLTDNKPVKGRGLHRYTKGELIAIGVAANSYYEIAGSGQGGAPVSANDDCAYGTYCTIDLGGPKIITYNDAGDIRDGQLADEDLTDEEYLEKYGEK